MYLYSQLYAALAVLGTVTVAHPASPHSHWYDDYGCGAAIPSVITKTVFRDFITTAYITASELSADVVIPSISHSAVLSSLLSQADSSVSSFSTSAFSSLTHTVAWPNSSFSGFPVTPTSLRVPTTSSNTTISSAKSSSVTRLFSTASMTTAPSLPNSSAGFIHPGLLHSDADFSRMQSKVKASAEPWITGWYKLTNNSHSFLQYSPSPQAIIYRGYDGTHVENYGSLYNDIAAGYALALRWKVSGDIAYADKAVSILNEWSSTLTSLQGTGDRFLASGIYGYQFANVAEIMRTYSGWSSTDFARFKSLMLDVFYPLNNDFLIRHNGASPFAYWANWDLCNMASILAIGVLTDNSTMYDQAIAYFKNGDGSGAINNTIWTIYEPEGLGQGQEAGRDQGHAMMDFSTLGAIAQMAWNQGLDLFGYDDNRILKGAEYATKYNLGYDVPYTTYYYAWGNVEQTVISNNSRGDIRPTWELFYAHYHDLKGLTANYTGQYRDKVKQDGAGAEGGGGDYGPNSGGFDQLGYGTLVYALA